MIHHAPVSRGRYPEPVLFMPHPNFSDEVNRNICQSEIEGGVSLDNLRVGAMLEVETTNRTYLLENCGDSRVLISGHPRHCLESVLVRLHGSTWGKSMIKRRFIGRGMYLEYWHPTRGVIRTSRIREIRELPTNRVAFFEGNVGRGHGYSASAPTAQNAQSLRLLRPQQ